MTNDTSDNGWRLAATNQPRSEAVKLGDAATEGWDNYWEYVNGS